MLFRSSAWVPGSLRTVLKSCWTISLALWFSLLVVYAHSPQAKRLKFDPLTEEERQLAIKIADADARVMRLRGSGRQVRASVDLATPKSAGETSRHAQVLYYLYSENQGVIAIVDLQRRSVSEVARLNGDGVPLTAEEVNEALGLAFQNKTLTNLLGADYQRYQVTSQNIAGQPRQVEALRTIARSPNDPCYRHRCLSLLFRRGDTFLTGTSVIVDLTARTVRVEQTGVRRTPQRRRVR